MITRLIHRVWLDDPMPDEFAAYGDRWRHLHPDWEILDWVDSSGLPTLIHQDLYDDAEQLCPRDWKRFRSDLVRLELLHRFGGVYVDTDVEPHQAIDDLVAGRECIVGYSPQTSPAGEHPITNAVMAATAGHPYIGACLDALPAAVQDFAGRSLAQMAGPWNLTRVYNASAWPAVTVLAHDELYGGRWLTHHWANARDNRRGGLT